jgi:hypothetical protein
LFFSASKDECEAALEQLAKTQAEKRANAESKVNHSGYEDSLAIVSSILDILLESTNLSTPRSEKLTVTVPTAVDNISDLDRLKSTLDWDQVGEHQAESRRKNRAQARENLAVKVCIKQSTECPDLALSSHLEENKQKKNDAAENRNAQVHFCFI